MFLLAAMAGLGVVGTLVNAGAGVFVVYAAALAGRLSPVRRAVVAVAVLAGLAGVMFLISTFPCRGDSSLLGRSSCSSW